MYKTLDNISKWIYNILVTRKRQEQEVTMENDMKDNLVAVLVSIREHAEQNKEPKTVELINKILEEIRKR